MIRLGELKDLAAIAPFDPFGDCRKLEIAEARLFVRENAAAQVVGYISLADYTFHGNPYIAFLNIHPAQRRNGYATDLLKHIEALYRGKRLFISTEADNQAMRALLQKQGYRFSGALSGLNDAHGGADELFFYSDP